MTPPLPERSRRRPDDTPQVRRNAGQICQRIAEPHRHEPRWRSWLPDASDSENSCTCSRRAQLRLAQLAAMLGTSDVLIQTPAKSAALLADPGSPQARE